MTSDATQIDGVPSLARQYLASIIQRVSMLKGANVQDPEQVVSLVELLLQLRLQHRQLGGECEHDY